MYVKISKCRTHRAYKFGRNIIAKIAFISSLQVIRKYFKSYRILLDMISVCLDLKVSSTWGSLWLHDVGKFVTTRRGEVCDYIKIYIKYRVRLCTRHFALSATASIMFSPDSASNLVRSSLILEGAGIAMIISHSNIHMPCYRGFLYIFTYFWVTVSTVIYFVSRLCVLAMT
jgi:hypothetical protein